MAGADETVGQSIRQEPLIHRALVSLRLRAADLLDSASGRRDRLTPPRRMSLYVGHGDFRATGEEFLGLFRSLVDLTADDRVLDIGCGIGRLETALAPRVASVTGIDLSGAMLEEARRRCGELPNVRFALGSGSDLVGIADSSVDLILLIDTLPYVLLSGPALAAQLCAESARVLKPRGSLLILNAQYGADADTELFELEQLAESADLEIHRADWSPFSFWDAPAFQLVKLADRSRA